MFTLASQTQTAPAKIQVSTKLDRLSFTNAFFRANSEPGLMVCDERGVWLEFIVSKLALEDGSGKRVIAYGYCPDPQLHYTQFYYNLESQSGWLG